MFGKTTPHPVGLPGGEGVGRALGPHWTAFTNTFCRVFAPTTGCASFSIWVEELGAVAVSASATVLPGPNVGYRTGKSMEVSHLTSLGDGRLVLQFVLRNVRTLLRVRPVVVIRWMIR